MRGLAYTREQEALLRQGSIKEDYRELWKKEGAASGEAAKTAGGKSKKID